MNLSTFCFAYYCWWLIGNSMKRLWFFVDALSKKQMVVVAAALWYWVSGVNEVNVLDNVCLYLLSASWKYVRVVFTWISKTQIFFVGKINCSQWFSVEYDDVRNIISHVRSWNCCKFVILKKKLFFLLKLFSTLYNSLNYFEYFLTD